MHDLRSIETCEDIHGKRILLHLDLNVPINDGRVANDFRLRKILPTLTHLKAKGARTVILSHIESESNTLEPVYSYLRTRFPDLRFVRDILDEWLGETLHSLPAGAMILAENLRLHKEEMSNDKGFAKKIASLGDIYCNDAFSVSHRRHASIVGVPEFLPHYAGPLFLKEIRELSFAFNPPKPFIFIIGGAKLDTKIPLIKKFLPIADKIFVGGALANNFFRALGHEVGRSVISEGDFDEQNLMKSGKIVLPSDVTAESDGKTSTKAPDKIMPNEKIVDVGPESMTELGDLVKTAGCVLWNGPLGYYEAGFKEPTLHLARLFSNINARTIVGGGDTLAAIAELNLFEKFSFVSTGGGAMLEFLAEGTLPGIEALTK